MSAGTCTDVARARAATTESWTERAQVRTVDARDLAPFGGPHDHLIARRTVSLVPPRIDHLVGPVAVDVRDHQRLRHGTNGSIGDELEKRHDVAAKIEADDADPANRSPARFDEPSELREPAAHAADLETLPDIPPAPELLLEDGDLAVGTHRPRRLLGVVGERRRRRPRTRREDQRRPERRDDRSETVATAHGS